MHAELGRDIEKRRMLYEFRSTYCRSRAKTLLIAKFIHQDLGSAAANLYLRNTWMNAGFRQRWKIQSISGIKDHLVVELHCSSDRPAKTGYQIEKRCFSRPGWTKNPCDWLVKQCVRLQSKINQRQPNIAKLQAHRGRLRIEII